MPAPYENPDDLATAIRDARRAADLSQAALGQRLGVSSKKVMRWEAGVLASLGDTKEKRFATAAQVAAATGDQSLIGKPDQPAATPTQDVEELRRVVGALVTLQTTEHLPDAARQLLETELAAARRWSSSDRNSEEPGSAAQNG